MIKLSEQILNLDLNELLKVLETDDDIENVLIILQIYEINTLADIEKLKLELKRIEQLDDEDDLLTNNETETSQKEKIQNSLKEKNNKGKQIREVINSILSRPMDFWKTNNPDSFANSLLGTIIIPDTKERRSETACGILFSLAKSKNKALENVHENSRHGFVKRIREIQQMRETANEKVF